MENPERNLKEENILIGERGRLCVLDIKRSVFDEYDRAYLEGTATKQKTEQQKQHVERVLEISSFAVSLLRQSGFSISEASERIIEIEAILHDALKIVPEREKGTSLLMHGIDSALWAKQLLPTLGFGDKLTRKIMKDINAHMGMPFLATALDNAKRLNNEGSQDSLPESFPDPMTIEGAVLFSADLLSPANLTGGCLDRYVAENLERAADGNMEKAWSTAVQSLKDNISRLNHPSNPEKRGQAAQVEMLLGSVIGSSAMHDIEGLDKYVRQLTGGWSSIKTMDNYYQAVHEYRKKLENSE